MSKLNAGEVEITLNGETLTLRPTIKAILGVNRSFGGLMKAVGTLTDGNIDAAATVIAHGLSLSDKEARKVSERVAENGITDGLLTALINFVGICSNGGKPLDDKADEEGGEGKEQGAG